MANEERDTQGFGNRKTNLEMNKGDGDSKRGMGIANDETTPNTLISDDSKDTIADQNHHGSDNNPNSSGSRTT